MIPVPKMKAQKPPRASRPAKTEKQNIAIDFDGVIHDKANPVEGMRMGLPIEGAKEALMGLKNNYTLIIHTVMATTPSGIHAVSDWLDYYEIPYDQVTATKPNAICYLDDKGLKFINWPQALKDIGEIHG